MTRTILYFALATSLLCGCSEGTNNKQADPPAQDTAKSPTVQPDGHHVVPLRNGGEMEGMIRDGKRHGLWVSRFPNGVLRSRTKYVQGVEEGPVEVFHANSLTYYKGQHLHGIPVGEWVFTDSTGNELKRVLYDNTGKVISK